MHADTLLLALALAAGPTGQPDLLLHGPAHCVLGYLEAVRLAAPQGPSLARLRRPTARDYSAARALLAPRTLVEIGRREASGLSHPLAPWREAAGGTVLESFALLQVRHAPRGTAVVSVLERWRRDGERRLGAGVSEYLVARVAGEWRVVDRRAGGRFEPREITDGYAGWFDEPAGGP